MARFYPPMHFANRTISGNILSSPGTQTVRHCFTYLHQIDNILAVCLRRLYISYIFVWTSSSKPITAQRCVRGVLRFKQLFITLIKLFLYGLKYMALKCHYSSWFLDVMKHLWFFIRLTLIETISTAVFWLVFPTHLLSVHQRCSSWCKDVTRIVCTVQPHSEKRGALQLYRMDNVMKVQYTHVLASAFNLVTLQYIVMHAHKLQCKMGVLFRLVLVNKFSGVDIPC